MADKTVGQRIKGRRLGRGWTQHQLATIADLDVTTIQRAEAGSHQTSHASLQALAAAFDIDVSTLRVGLSEERADELRELYLCDTCGAELVSRNDIQHEYGDDVLNEYACGHTDGWQFRPCPRDPRFPAFEDYEIRYHQEGDQWYAYALGKTDMARAVCLSNAEGDTQADALRLMRRAYIQARYGYEEAERQYPLFV